MKEFRQKYEQVISKLSIDDKGVTKDTLDAVMESYQDKYASLFKMASNGRFCKQFELILHPRVVSYFNYCYTHVYAYICSLFNITGGLLYSWKSH